MAKGVSKPRRRGTNSRYENFQKGQSESPRAMALKVKQKVKNAITGRRAVRNIQEFESVKGQERFQKQHKAKLKSLDKSDGNNDSINRRSQENL
jgi:hypothetical protein